MTGDLFPPQRFRAYAPEKPRARKPYAAPVRFGAGWCDASCIYATGNDCDCACQGANHRSGFRCDSLPAPTTPRLI
jgi:hypothetical protein